LELVNNLVGPQHWLHRVDLLRGGTDDAGNATAREQLQQRRLAFDRVTARVALWNEELLTQHPIGGIHLRLGDLSTLVDALTQTR
jgi:hypothetical protein